jgi:hypothetical protein
MLIDICGADWPQREKRFDVVYHLLSLTKNRASGQGRDRREHAVPSSCRLSSGRRTGSSARPSTCTASPSPAIPICAAPHRLRLLRPSAAQGFSR